MKPLYVLCKTSVMKHLILLILFVFCFINCNQVKKEEITQTSLKNKITCTKTECQGTYIGKEFINGDDIAHQFSNQMSEAVGDQLKTLFKSSDYSKVNFKNIIMTTVGMGSGEVTYHLSIPFMTVRTECEAYTSFDHVGGWNHAPALSQRKVQLQDVLLPGEHLDISNLKVTAEGLQEYWIQWKHKVVQAECE